MDATELSACLRQYGLRASGHAQPLPGGNVGQVTMVPTEQGPLVVKRFNQRFDIARIQLAAQAHHHAALAGLAPRMRRTREGNWIARVNDATYTLSEYVGRAERPGHAALASALAALHARFEHFTPDGSCADFLQLSDPPTADLAGIRSQTHDPARREVIDWRNRILAEFGLSGPSVAAMPRSWVHGDARPDNLLLKRTPDRQMFIDFDQVSRFPRAYEIVRAFTAFVGPGLTAQLLGSTFRNYLNAYHVIMPIPAKDRSTMIDLYITVQAAETRTFTTPQSEVRGMLAFTQARHRQLVWIIRHRDLLRRVAEEARS